MGILICFICVAVVGAMCIYSGYSMKESGILRVGWLVGRDLKYEKCRDIPGFIQVIYKDTITFGWICLLGAVVVIILQIFHKWVFLALPILVMIFVAYFWFNHKLTKATKEYLE